MKQLFLRLTGLAGVALVALPPFVAGATTQDAIPTSPTDVLPTVIWTIVAVSILCLVGGTFYMFKRRIGGFPEHPTWVAPITIMESKDFPNETTFEDVAPTADNHGHGH